MTCEGSNITKNFILSAIFNRVDIKTINYKKHKQHQYAKCTFSLLTLSDVNLMSCTCSLVNNFNNELAFKILEFLQRMK